MREFRRQKRALPDAEFAALRDSLLASPLVGRSTLAGPFQSSRGFAVIFKREGRERVEGRFPALKAWFDVVLGEPAVRALTPWWTRSVTRIPNAWYLNVLLVSEGGTVSRHVDATLRKPAGESEAVPELVTVLYLSVPNARGGTLQLWSGPTPVGEVKPLENSSVHFRGDLAHQVNAFDGAKDAVRASLVIEQYHFADDALARLPDFRLESRAGFSAYLEHHQHLCVEP
ncbi:MAG: 2OG-Fe(II) oxygenase [Archangium sp.]